MNVDGVEPTEKEKKENIVQLPNHPEYGLSLLHSLYDLNEKGYCVSKKTLNEIKIYLKTVGKIL